MYFANASSLEAHVAYGRDPGCMLVPVYPPHFRHLQRLLRSVARFATDSAPIYVVFDTAKDAINFQELEATRDVTNLYKAIDFSRVLGDFGENTSAIMPLGLDRRTSGRACFDGVRSYQALKKLMCAASLANQCEWVWVLDSESEAFDSFSFSRIFAEVRADPAYVVERPFSRACNVYTLRDLFGCTRPHMQSGEYGAQGDWWTWQTSLARELIQSVRKRSGGRPFSASYLPNACPSHTVVAGFVDCAHRTASSTFKSTCAGCSQVAIRDMPATWHALLQDPRTDTCGLTRNVAELRMRGKVPKTLKRMFFTGFPLLQGAQQAALHAEGAGSSGTAAGVDARCLARLMRRLLPIHGFSSYLLRELLPGGSVGRANLQFAAEFLHETGVRWCLSNCPTDMGKQLRHLLATARRARKPTSGSRPGGNWSHAPDDHCGRSCSSSVSGP